MKLLAIGAMVTTVLATNTPAQSQTYGRLIVLGDSLSDNGNNYRLVGLPRSPPYFAGRYSNGPVFTELLGFTAVNYNGPRDGSVNVAFGEARADTSSSLDIRSQYAIFRGVGGRLDPQDLVSIQGGSNNIFQGLPVAATAANPSAYMEGVAANAAFHIGAAVDQLAANGAGAILVGNLPMLSLTPQIRRSPRAIPLTELAVTTFNSRLLLELEPIARARPDTNIIVMDVAKIGSVIAGNPGRFGLSNVSDACFDGLTVCANPDSYLYFDQVNPSAAGHRLMAQLATDYLYYGDRGAGSTLQAETAHRYREDALDTAATHLASAAPWAAGTSISGQGLYDHSRTDARGAVAAATDESHGAHLALESGSESWRFGLVGNYRDGEVRSDATRFDLQSIGLDVYGGWRRGPLFVTATTGIASDDYNTIDRVSALAPIVQTATSRGFSSGARLQIGVWFDAGPIALSPRLAATYSRSEIEGYVEEGAAASYAYGDRKLERMTGEFSVRAEGDLGGFTVFAEGGYRDVLSDDTDSVRVRISGNTARELTRAFDDPFGGTGLVSFGARGDLGPTQIEVGYRGRFGDQASSHRGGVTLTLPL